MGEPQDFLAFPTSAQLLSAVALPVSSVGASCIENITDETSDTNAVTSSWCAGAPARQTVFSTQIRTTARAATADALAGSQWRGSRQGGPKGGGGWERTSRTRGRRGGG